MTQDEADDIISEIQAVVDDRVEITELYDYIDEADITDDQKEWAKENVGLLITVVNAGGL